MCYNVDLKGKHATFLRTYHLARLQLFGSTFLTRSRLSIGDRIRKYGAVGRIITAQFNHLGLY